MNFKFIFWLLKKLFLFEQIEKFWLFVIIKIYIDSYKRCLKKSYNSQRFK